MDVDWMRGKLESYIQLIDAYDQTYRANGYQYTDQMRVHDEEATRAEPTVLEILKRLDPALVADFSGPACELSNAKRRCMKALGILQDRNEWSKRFAPEAPSLNADQMHPLMWRAASTIWSTSEYKTAIQQAAVALSAHIKSRASSPLNDRELAAQVFAPDPPRFAQTRLHFDGDPTDKNWQSRQQGLHLMAQAAFAGIRNIAVHDDIVWTEHEALEHLAVLSVVARWTDETNVVTP